MRECRQEEKHGRMGFTTPKEYVRMKKCPGREGVLQMAVLVLK